VKVFYAKTTDVEQISQGFISEENGSTFEGGMIISATGMFATQRIAGVTAANEITVGVRAVSNGAAGSAIASDGRGQIFYQHTTSVALPAKNVTISEDTTKTFYLNSFTAKDSDGVTEGQFDVVGEAVSQHMRPHIANSFAGSATVLGGNLAGEAIINKGRYETFAVVASGQSEVSEPIAVAWSAGAATTAWLPAFRAETVTTDGPVLAISRHSFTDIVDE
jgi:hypothetical protein